MAHYRVTPRFDLMKMPFENKAVEEIYHEFANDEGHSRYLPKCALDNLADSLGGYIDTITSAEDFNENVFWAQINYFKEKFADDKKKREDAVRGIVFFYRWIVKAYPDIDFFKASFHLCRNVLYSQSLITMINRDFYFTVYDPADPPLGEKNVCFIMRNMAKLSTNLTDDDYMPIRLDSIESPFYRDLIIRYVLAGGDFGAMVTGSSYRGIAQVMRVLDEVKAQEFYPNPDLSVLTVQEAVFIRNLINRGRRGIVALNNNIGYVRRFLQWCQRAGYITFDAMFFDYLRQYEEPSTVSGQAVPEEDLIKMNDYIVDRAESDYEWKLTYYVFHLLLDTNFRCGMVCRLTTDCVSPSMKPGEYVLLGNDKVTHDSKRKKFVITEATKNLIMEAIEYTEDMREKCSDDTVRKYIFILPGRMGAYRAAYTDWFSLQMKRLCAALDIPNYTAANLRDTYMTKAAEYVMRHGKSDLELGLLSRHKRIDTTNNHYIQLRLEKMLEPVFSVDLGPVEDVDTDSKVVDTIPNELSGEENDVEEGCGKCTRSECTITGPAACLICPSFITTAEYEPVFIALINAIDTKIAAAANRHDVEDLATIKALYVKYLQSIYEKEEELHDNESGVRG